MLIVQCSHAYVTYKNITRWVTLGSSEVKYFYLGTYLRPVHSRSVPEYSSSLIAMSMAARIQKPKVNPNSMSIMISVQFHILLKYRCGPCIRHMRRADQEYPQTYSIRGASAPNRATYKFPTRIYFCEILG